MLDLEGRGQKWAESKKCPPSRPKKCPSTQKVPPDPKMDLDISGGAFIQLTLSHHIITVI
jgi:hypothetical protein